MRCLLSIIILLFLNACRNDRIPEGILGPDKMQDVYWDMMRADEMAIHYQSTDTAYTIGSKKNQELYLAILRIHGISKEDFIRSERYYETHPELLKTVLDSIYRKAERLQQADTAVKQIPTTVADTLSRRPLKVPDSFKKRKRLVLVDSL